MILLSEYEGQVEIIYSIISSKLKFGISCLGALTLHPGGGSKPQAEGRTKEKEMGRKRSGREREK